MEPKWCGSSEDNGHPAFHTQVTVYSVEVEQRVELSARKREKIKTDAVKIKEKSRGREDEDNRETATKANKVPTWQLHGEKTTKLNCNIANWRTIGGLFEGNFLVFTFKPYHLLCNPSKSSLGPLVLQSLKPAFRLHGKTCLYFLRWWICAAAAASPFILFQLCA